MVYQYSGRVLRFHTRALVQNNGLTQLFCCDRKFVACEPLYSGLSVQRSTRGQICYHLYRGDHYNERYFCTETRSPGRNIEPLYREPLYGESTVQRVQCI